MYIKKEIDFGDLQDMCWSGAIDTLNTIEENRKEDELIALLEEVFCDEMPTVTEVNDFLWFESETIFDALGITEDEEEDEEEEAEEDEEWKVLMELNKK